MDGLADTRFEPFVEYEARFLLWWGLLGFLCQLGSRRQLDFELRDRQSHVLANVNALAQSAQEALPVHKTLAHYLGHVGHEAIETFRARMVRRLIRQKVFDDSRLLGRLVVACDGTGHLSFQRRHCPDCLTARHGRRTYYYHEVCEAKIVTRSGLAVSIGTEFLDNRLRRKGQPQAEELGAFARLADALHADYPQTPLCLAGDSLYACGAVLTICERNRWAYVLTFKPKHMPAVWQEFEALLALCPDQVRYLTLPDKTASVAAAVATLARPQSVPWPAARLALPTGAAPRRTGIPLGPRPGIHRRCGADASLPRHRLPRDHPRRLPTHLRLDHQPACDRRHGHRHRPTGRTRPLED